MFLSSRIDDDDTFRGDVSFLVFVLSVLKSYKILETESDRSLWGRNGESKQLVNHELRFRVPQTRFSHPATESQYRPAAEGN
jgi:hypothetical protein